jgi:hypothetical protein
MVFISETAENLKRQSKRCFFYDKKFWRVDQGDSSLFLPVATLRFGP